MTPRDIILTAKAEGVELEVAGNDLVLEAGIEPPTDLLETIRRHKAAIIAALQSASRSGAWDTADWQAFFDERAAIAEFDAGLPHVEAEAIAFERCVAEWLLRAPVASDRGRCLWCRKPEAEGAAVLPFAIRSGASVWLHASCWHDWRLRRETDAIAALAAFGITPPSSWSGRLPAEGPR